MNSPEPKAGPVIRRHATRDAGWSLEDEGLDPSDRPRTLRLLFKRHGRECVEPTVPTRVEILRTRTGMIEAWEVIAWLPLSSEYVAWRRDTNYDGRLKAKEFFAEDDGNFEGHPIDLAEEWTDEPAEDDEEIVINPEPAPILDEGTFLQVLDLGLTEPNSEDLARLGKKPSDD